MPLTLPTLGQLEQFLSWLFGDALSWANIVQVPALFLTGGAAWVLCHPVRARITAWADRHPDRHHLDWLVQHRPLATRRLVPLITPAVWAIGLWISVSVAEYGGWPHAVAQVAVNLLMAWLVIRLAAEMVPNQVLARLIAVLSWSVAALNITHLLEPTLQLLDNAAIVTGGLRVSLLTVTKGVLSLTILLWAASLASKLFERRITRVSQITPRARVLLGKLLKTTLVSVAVLLSLVSIGIDLSTFALFTVRSGSASGSVCSGRFPTCSAAWCCCSTNRSSQATSSRSAALMAGCPLLALGMLPWKPATAQSSSFPMRTSSPIR